MAYHDLSECSLTPDERLAEAGRIIELIAMLVDFKTLPTNECSLIENMQSSCSVKQLFWLRDIKDRVMG